MQNLIWLRTNEEIEAINALEKFHQFILEICNDKYQWKWAIIALHNSVQAFMVLALKGSASFNVLKDKDKKDWYNACYAQETLASERIDKMQLDSFISLYKRIQSQEMDKYTSSKRFIGDDQKYNSMLLLNELRNKFIHYIPCNWSLCINFLPELCRQIFSITDFLIFESGNIHFYDEDNCEKAQKLIFSIREELNRLEAEYSNQNEYTTKYQ